MIKEKLQNEGSQLFMALMKMPSGLISEITLTSHGRLALEEHVENVYKNQMVPLTSKNHGIDIGKIAGIDIKVNCDR